METLLAAIMALIALSAIILRIKVSVLLDYNRAAENDTLSVSIWLLRRLIEYRMEVPLINIWDTYIVPWAKAEIEAGEEKFTNKPERERRFVKKTIKAFLEHTRLWRKLHCQIRWFTRIYKYVMNILMKNLVCEKLVCKTKVGTGDAALTGLAAGAFWPVISLLYMGMERRVMMIHQPCFELTPDYCKSRVEVNFQCIISVRLGNVINAFLRILQFPYEEACEYGRASNTELDEDSHGKH
ncbi:MAG: hypothetical protein H6Q75_174 [Firmicutes bacterium]|nr:hypothetical protein [Bacillota bacterium]